MVQWIQSAAVALLFLATLLTGCLGGDASEDRTEEERDPQWRVRAVEWDSKQHSNCWKGPASLESWDCVDPSTELTFECDPDQAVFVSQGLSDPQSDWEGPGDAYLFCEYTLSWELTVSALAPDTTVHVIVKLDDQNQQESCSTELDGGCTLKGEVTGTWEQYRAGGYHEISASLFGSFHSGLDLPGGFGSGYGQITEDLRIKL